MSKTPRSQRAGSRGDTGQAAALVVVLVAFAVLAALVYANNQNPEIRRINLVAQQYADAWRNGGLASLRYDELSHPDVDKGDAGKIADNVAWMTHYLDDTGKLRPEKVEVERSETARVGDEHLATAKLWVTWKLAPTGLEQRAYSWTYPVTLQERLSDGRWRVVWSPQTVHPDLRPGLVLKVERTQPARASILGAGDTLLYPVAKGQPATARAVIGAITAQASPDQAELAALRAREKDTVGISGLQDLYDDRLAGTAGIRVVSYTAQGFGKDRRSDKPELGSAVQPLFVGPPETPKPLRTTLDKRTQGFAQAALTGVTGTATVVVVKPSTGELLAVANSGDDDPLPAKASDARARLDHDYGLSSQQPPGPVFQLASTLALLRAGYTMTSRIDCTNRYSAGGQVFENTQGPSLKDVTLGAAAEGGCVTGFARSAGLVDPGALQAAAYDLGIATPRDPSNNAPGWLQVADQLGTPAFHGQVPAKADPVTHAENMVGEGAVLASPLSMARAAATVATGTRHAVRLVVDPAAERPDVPATLAEPEIAALQEVMAKGVTEPGGSAHALASSGGVHALAGTGGYGTGKGQKRQAWCVGYIGDYAFAVLVPDVAGTPAQANAQAVAIAGKFVTSVR